MTSAEQRIEDALKNKLKALRDGTFRFPCEPPVPSQPRLSDSDAAASVRSNAQHHAVPPELPRGRTPAAEPEEDGEGDGCDDGDSEDPHFKQFYTIAEAQLAFNRQAVREWHAHASKRATAVIHPPDVLRGGCQPAHIGLGACHVHSPHKFLGLPHPPCPNGHGWKAVDQGKVRTSGRCPARRVYADAIDEWVCGDLMICDLCLAERERRQAALDELRESADEGLDVEDEIEEAEAAVKAAVYSYRSYDPRSIALYAQRYAWCVLTFERVCQLHVSLAPPAPCPHGAADSGCACCFPSPYSQPQPSAGPGDRCKVDRPGR